MSSISGVVTPGYTWTEDANLITQITRTRLNLSTKPSVLITLTDVISTEDIKASSVTKEKIADEISDKIISGTATVGDESSDAITVSIQLIDCQGNALSSTGQVDVWLSENSAGGPNVTTFPDGSVSVSDGTELVKNSDNQIGKYLTNSNGVLTLVYTHAGSGMSLYFVAVISGKYIAGSKVLTWA